MESTESLSKPAHKFCLDLLPKISAEKAALESLLCGEKVAEPQLQEQLRQTSLLHLFVVSGAHLLWLETALGFLKVPLVFRIFSWVLFAFGCSAQAPVVRALIGLIGQKLRAFRFPGWRPDQQVFWTGIATLTFYPSWGESLSLALSWGAAVALTLSWGEGWRRALRQGLALWIILLPMLSGWASTHPFGLLVNLFLAPLLTVVLMPSAILAVLCPPLCGIFDFLFGLFRQIMVVAPAFNEKSFGATPPSPLFFWCWLMGVHLAAHLFFVWKNRRGT